MTHLFLKLMTIVHFFSMTGLALYGIHRIWMIGCWCRTKTGLKIDPEPGQDTDLPKVTVQVPLYNEALVAERIIDAVAAFDWPADRLQIQILDDSTDVTCRIVEERIRFWQRRGKDIQAIHRARRTGYKAGALAHGLKQATGEFIAVFDADFVPRPDFLVKLIPCFNRPDIGMVQARWGFLNVGFSWLTRLQSLLLSTHFGVEHAMRYSRNLFFNFNGTAGVWRKAAIENSGGWTSDTVTEDLDLSYRAQLAGWRFVYADHVCVPSELPVTLADFRCQQERWAKGAIQTAVKLLPRLVAAPLPLRVKIEAAAHLMANFCWVLGFLATFTLYPVLLNRIGIGVREIFWFDLPLFLLTGVAVIAYYMIYSALSGTGWQLGVLSLLPAASIGLAPSFSLAVLKGLTTTGGVFQRTPKFGVTDSGPGQFRVRFHSRILLNLAINIPLWIYSLVPVVFAWHRGTWPALPFLCFFPLGFGIIIATDGRELLQGMFSRQDCKAL
ncbi:MAG: glycosyltransferase [Pseudomonadota bacterium]